MGKIFIKFANEAFSIDCIVIGQTTYDLDHVIMILTYSVFYSCWLKIDPVMCFLILILFFEKFEIPQTYFTALHKKQHHHKRHLRVFSSSFFYVTISHFWSVNIWTWSKITIQLSFPITTIVNMWRATCIRIRHLSEPPAKYKEKIK